MKKNIRILLLQILAIMLLTPCISCDKDEDLILDSLYTIECTEVSGGGYSQQECESIKASLNLNYDQNDYNINKCNTKKEAIREFNRFIAQVEKEFSSFSSEEPLNITFALKLIEFYSKEPTKRETIVKSYTIVID